VLNQNHLNNLLAIAEWRHVCGASAAHIGQQDWI
jgi:hypothetical protein